MGLIYNVLLHRSGDRWVNVAMKVLNVNSGGVGVKSCKNTKSVCVGFTTCNSTLSIRMIVQIQ